MAGAARRTKNHHDRLRAAGLIPRQHWVTDGENTQIKRIIKQWRGQDSGMSVVEKEAADILKPVEGAEK